MSDKYPWSEYQTAIFDDVSHGEGHTVVDALAGSGKCLGKGTPVLMYDGRIKPVEEIRAGEVLMGPDSEPRKVLSTNVGNGPLYKVKPIKGDEWICNDEHILTLMGTNYLNGKLRDVSVKNLLKETPSKHGRHDNCWKLFRTFVNFPIKEKLEIDPYLVGLWIGDGKTEGPVIWSADAEVQDFLREAANQLGLQLRETFEKENLIRFRFAVGKRGDAGSHTPNRFRRLIKNECINEAGHKQIPHRYLTSSRVERRLLLAGIIDSDGHNAGGYYEVTTKLESLADQYCFLARSLGFAAYKKEKRATITGFEVQVWRVSISGNFWTLPVKIERKKIGYRQQIKRVNVTGFELEPIGDGEYFGFTLDGDGRFLLGDFTVTHNTSTIIESLEYIPEGKSWLLVAFNKRIAEELKKKAPMGGDIRTLHSLGLRALDKKFPKLTVANDKVDRILHKVVGKDKKLWDVKRQIQKTVSLAKAYLVEGAEFIDFIMDNHDIDTFDMDRKIFIENVQDVLRECAKNTKEVDFDDMIWLPHVHKVFVQRYHYVFVDEAQDLNNAQIALALKACKRNGRIICFGDRNQCVSVDTLVDTETHGKIKASDLRIGDRILSYRNGEITYANVTHIAPSDWRFGAQITTESGKQFLMSPNHKIWASAPVLKDNQAIVYLMYREGFGFRVGKTNKWKDGEYPFELRAQHEKADKLWVLKICDSNDDALLEEELYSLGFGIPKCVYEAEGRNVNEIFSMYGQNGRKLLKKHYLSEDHPHYTVGSCTSKNKNRKTIHVNAHAAKNTQVTLEWSDDETTMALEKAGISYFSGKNNRIRKYTACYTDAIKFANQLAEATGAQINERLSFEGMPALVTASGLHRGMNVLINQDGNLEYDKILRVERWVGAKFIDIEVEDSANFFGNDVLSHNSIYGFRGASSDAISQIKKRLNAKSLPLSITYRCPVRVTKEAQKYVPEIEWAPSAKEGIIDHIEASQLTRAAEPGCFILSRTNAPLVSYALQFISKGVPASIQGKDIGDNLLNLIKKSRRKNLENFLDWLFTWEQKEVARLRKKNRDFDHVRDKAACLRAIAGSSCASLADLKTKIIDLFEDTDEKDRIILSTVHKAKGLERDVVFVLWGTFRGGNREERNIRYVAVTRSKRELYYVV